MNGLTLDHKLQATNADRVDQKPFVQSAPQQTIVSAVDVKTENQRRAELLRAKLLAQRNNTPGRQQALSRSNAPAKAMSRIETPSKAPLPRTIPAQTPAQQPPPPNTPQNLHDNMNMDGDEPAGELLDLDALLDEGKALADAKSAAMAADRVNASPAPTQALPSRTVSLTNGHGNDVANASTPQTRHKNTAEKDTNAKMSKAHGQPTPLKIQTAECAAEPSRLRTDLSDAYYADLPAWLEMTGYHDIGFRTSKLAAYKERKSLEEEAARIADRLEKLRQLEQENVQSLRFSTANAAAHMAPPPLPATMVLEKPVGQVNGHKRAHSPEPISTSKRREENGFRIRGANDSPDTGRPPSSTLRRRISASPPPNRRVSYPESRNRPVDDDRSRDPSLEHRMPFYHRDSTDFQRRGPEYPVRAREADRERDYDHYQPRDSRDGPRLGFSTTNMARSSRPAPATPASHYRGSEGLDLKRGGQSHFTSYLNY